MNGPSDSPRPAVSPSPPAGRRLRAVRRLFVATALASALAVLAVSSAPAQAPDPAPASGEGVDGAGDASDPAGTEAARLTDGRVTTPFWVKAVTGAGTLGALIAFDPSIRREPTFRTSDAQMLPRESGVPGTVADFGNTLGDWEATLPWLAGASLAVGGLTEGMDGVGRAGALVVGVAAGSFTTVAIKKAVGRRRPSNVDDAVVLDPFEGPISFPSGHAAYAFAIAGGVDAVTEGWLPAAAAYAVASTSAFARVYSGKHWFSDVVVGSAVGALASRAATSRMLRLLDLRREDGSRPARRDDARGLGDHGAADRDARRSGPTVELVAVPSFLGVNVRF